MRKLADTKNMSREEWLALRKVGIGGSDVAAICNLSRYRSALSVYMDKLGLLPPIEDNPRMKAGRYLEDVIAKMFEDETGMKTSKKNGILQHNKYPFMLANIDRWIPSEKAGLEIKNTSEYNREQWKGTSAPTEYILQCNHYMAVTGASKWYICALIGGWELEWKVIERDDELINNLITIETEFWRKVQAGEPPEVSAQDTELLNQLYPQSEPASEVEIGEQAYELIENAKSAKQGEIEFRRLKEEAQNKLKALMEDNEIALINGERVATWRTNSKGVRMFKIISEGVQT